MPVPCCRQLARPAPVLYRDRTACLQRWQLADRQRPPRRGAGGAATASASAGNSHTAGSAAHPCHYATLGVPRTASKAEVKRAFRQLARLWHPDVNPSSAASERFKAIARAFEVLSDEAQRRRYDELRWGFSSSGSGGGNSRSRPRRGAAHAAERPPPDLHAVLHLDFREAALGAERSVEVQVMDACSACCGTGAAAGTVATPCPMCKGRREIVKRQQPRGRGSQHGEEAGHIPLTVCCPVCAGRGFSVTHPCACCGGEGLSRRLRRVAVRVPAGAENGSRLRVSGQGDVARVGGLRGGLVLELQVRPEEGIRREGLDLHSQLAVPLWDALLGGTATVSTLRGAASLTIPPGTQHGAVLSLLHAGLEREESTAAAGGPRRGQRRQEGKAPRLRGAHHFQVLVQLPREVSSAEQALLQRLAELQR